jgi:transmembrane sensor
MEKFHELLDRYISRTATEEEKECFFELLETGLYDDIIISEGVREILDADVTPTTREERILQASRQRIYVSILQQNRVLEESKVVPFRTRSPRLWLAVATIVPMTLAISLVWIVARRDIVPTTKVVGQEKVSKPGVYVGKQVVDLPDGTQVILNDNSELSYSSYFGESNREVLLTGEASFDVTHDASRPFIVRTGKVSTKVLGTVFNISAYPNQNQITVTVSRGSVEVSNDQQVYGKITPDQQISVNATTYDFVKKDTRAEEEMAWQSNFLILDDVTLEVAALRIGKKFNANITFQNPELKTCKFYGSFLNDETLTDILTMMSAVLHITYKVENGNVVISGKGCN